MYVAIYLFHPRSPDQSCRPKLLLPFKHFSSPALFEDVEPSAAKYQKDRSSFKEESFWLFRYFLVAFPLPKSRQLILKLWLTPSLRIPSFPSYSKSNTHGRGSGDEEMEYFIRGFLFSFPSLEARIYEAANRTNAFSFSFSCQTHYKSPDRGRGRRENLGFCLVKGRIVLSVFVIQPNIYEMHSFMRNGTEKAMANNCIKCKNIKIQLLVAF